MSVHSPSPQPSLSQFVSDALSGPSLAAPQETTAELKLDAEDAPWMLPKGRAVTLRPRTAGVLRVVSGRAWATLDVSRQTPLLETGDHFVALGHDLQLRAGQRVVVEAWPYKGQEGIQLQWVAQPQTCLATRFQTNVAQPLRDMGQGLSLVVRALGRLVAGLAGYTDFLTAGRGRVLRGLESNAP